MNSLHAAPSFVEWAFGREFADRLDAMPPAPVADPDDVEGDPSTWPAWCDEDTWELGSDPDDEPRPTADFGLLPRPSDEAFWAGFTLGLDCEDAAAPSHFTRSEARQFDAGWSAGFREWERRLDEMFLDSAATALTSGGLTDADVWPGGYC